MIFNDFDRITLTFQIDTKGVKEEEKESAEYFCYDLCATFMRNLATFHVTYVSLVDQTSYDVNWDDNTFCLSFRAALPEPKIHTNSHNADFKFSEIVQIPGNQNLS